MSYRPTPGRYVRMDQDFYVHPKVAPLPCEVQVYLGHLTTRAFKMASGGRVSKHLRQHAWNEVHCQHQSPVMQERSPSGRVRTRPMTHKDADELLLDAGLLEPCHEVADDLHDECISDADDLHLHDFADWQVTLASQSRKQANSRERSQRYRLRKKAGVTHHHATVTRDADVASRTNKEKDLEEKKRGGFIKYVDPRVHAHAPAPARGKVEGLTEKAGFGNPPPPQGSTPWDSDSMLETRPSELLRVAERVHRDEEFMSPFFDPTFPDTYAPQEHADAPSPWDEPLPEDPAPSEPRSARSSGIFRVARASHRDVTVEATPPPPPPPPAPVATPRPTAFGKTPCPDTLELPQEFLAGLAIAGLPTPTPEHVLKFIAHHQAEGTTCVDWLAKFKCWMINQRRFDSIDKLKATKGTEVRPGQPMAPMLTEEEQYGAFVASFRKTHPNVRDENLRVAWLGKKHALDVNAGKAVWDDAQYWPMVAAQKWPTTPNLLERHPFDPADPKGDRTERLKAQIQQLEAAKANAAHAAAVLEQLSTIAGPMAPSAPLPSPLPLPSLPGRERAPTPAEPLPNKADEEFAMFAARAAEITRQRRAEIAFNDKEDLDERRRRRDAQVARDHEDLPYRGPSVRSTRGMAQGSDLFGRAVESLRRHA